MKTKQLLDAIQEFIVNFEDGYELTLDDIHEIGKKFVSLDNTMKNADVWKIAKIEKMMMSINSDIKVVSKTESQGSLNWINITFLYLEPTDFLEHFKHVALDKRVHTETNTYILHADEGYKHLIRFSFWDNEFKHPDYNNMMTKINEQIARQDVKS